jgi:hypothetical protein
MAMLKKDAATRPAEQLAEIIERQVVQRTWGRIHRLAVEVIGDRVIVHGCTTTYYSKQLALEGALEALGSTDSSHVELDIHVSNILRRSIN